MSIQERLAPVTDEPLMAVPRATPPPEGRGLRFHAALSARAGGVLGMPRSPRQWECRDWVIAPSVVLEIGLELFDADRLAGPVDDGQPVGEVVDFLRARRVTVGEALGFGDVPGEFEVVATCPVMTAIRSRAIMSASPRNRAWVAWLISGTSSSHQPCSAGSTRTR